MDQVFLPYTFLKSEISMKILLTFLTIALFSFGTKAGLFHDTPIGKKRRCDFRALLKYFE